MSLPDAMLAHITTSVPTPFYCYDATELRSRFRGLKRHLPEGADIYYSLKANPNRAIVSILKDEGAGAEVCSLAELRIALAAGADRRRIIFVGPAKSESELAACIETGIKAIVAESLAELKKINTLAAERGRVQPVGIRLNPNFKSAKVRIAMTGRASQFGIDEDHLAEIPALLGDCRHIVLVGLHVYLGSRILDEEAILENTANIFDLARRVCGMLGHGLAFVDVGGGIGVPYFDKERDIDADMLGRRLGEMITAFRAETRRTRVIVELGRFLVARAGVFVTSVRYVKDSKGKRFAICDGGSNVHAAAAGYGSAFRRNFPIAKIGAQGAARTYTLTGPLCTPSDTMGSDVALPELSEGDLIRFDRSGAYGPSASPVHFLSFGHPAEVMVDGGVVAMIRRADAPDDVLSRQIWQRLEMPVADALDGGIREVEHVG